MSRVPICIVGAFLTLMPAMAHASAWLGHLEDAPALQRIGDAPVGAWRDIEIKASVVGSEASARPGTIETASIRVGKLKFRGNIVLTSPDRAFGGFSGLRLSGDGSTLYAISDRGQWLSAAIQYDGQSAISGLNNARMASMMRYNGEALEGVAGDAEALELMADGSAIVGFERYHRLDHYRLLENGQFAYRQRILHNRVAKGLEPNGALEGVVLLKDNRVLAIAEDTAVPIAWSPLDAALVADEARPGFLSPPDIWFEGGDDWSPLAYQPADGFSVTDLAQDDLTGDIYVLERAYSPAKGVRATLSRLQPEEIQPGAVLKGEELARLNMLHGIDNLEAMDLRRTEDNRLMLYLLSDDNFSLTQRTVLMSWEVLPD